MWIFKQRCACVSHVTPMTGLTSEWKYLEWRGAKSSRRCGWWAEVALGRIILHHHIKTAPPETRSHIDRQPFTLSLLGIRGCQNLPLGHWVSAGGQTRETNPGWFATRPPTPPDPAPHVLGGSVPTASAAGGLCLPLSQEWGQGPSRTGLPPAWWCDASGSCRWRKDRPTSINSGAAKLWELVLGSPSWLYSIPRGIYSSSEKNK